MKYGKVIYGHGEEYLPIEINKYSFKDDLPNSNYKELIYTINKEKDNWNIKYSNNKNEDTYIKLPLLYYTGYQVIDSSNTNNKLINNNTGLVTVKLSDESGYLTVKYTGTIWLKTGYIITGITICCMVIYLTRIYYIYVTKKIKNAQKIKNSCN